MFRQQYSKIGNTREQLFYAWRSFHFDENTETIDALGLNVWSVESMSILLGSALLDEKIGRQNKYNKCLA